MERKGDDRRGGGELKKGKGRERHVEGRGREEERK